MKSGSVSFAKRVKRELSSVTPPSRHCRRASLAAVLMCAGEPVTEQDGSRALAVNTDTPEQAGKVFTLLQKTVNIDFGLHQTSPQALSQASEGADMQAGGTKGKYKDDKETARTGAEIRLSQEQVQKICGELKISEEGEGVFGLRTLAEAPFLEKQCCRRCFIRETFLCAGSVNDPRKGYHLEFSCAREAQAQLIREILRGFSLDAKIVRRGKFHIVYLKDSEDIVNTLNLMGAAAGVLEMENQRILKELRGSVNRRVNCETANIGKTVSAAQRQLEDIRFLQERGFLEQLPPSLRTMARLRLDYPDLSLRELGELAEPPVGKSGVNHRLRKLSEIADKYGNR